jgi:hypothetical protein
MLEKPYTVAELEAKRRRVATKHPLRPSQPPIFVPHVPDAEFFPIPTEEKKKCRYTYTPAIPQEEWNNLRSEILLRDGLICTECGNVERTLGIHHIDYDKTNNDPDNLETLCWPCHRARHHKKGRE